MGTSQREDVMKVTKKCRLCRTGLHLVQDSSGSMWMHDTAAAEHTCWSEHRDEYEQAGCEL